jgi:ketosteroid isomerase-like protein
MSQENVEIVRMAMAAATAQPPDIKTINALYHPEHVLTSDWGVEGKTYHGAAGFAAAVADLDAAWQEWRQELDDVLEAGETDVLALMRLIARGKESGAPVERPWAMLITLRDGELVASRTFLDQQAALAFAGLSRPPAGPLPRAAPHAHPAGPAAPTSSKAVPASSPRTRAR